MFGRGFGLRPARKLDRHAGLLARLSVSRRLIGSRYIVQHGRESGHECWRSGYLSTPKGATALPKLTLFAWKCCEYSLGQSETPILRLYCQTSRALPSLHLPTRLFSPNDESSGSYNSVRPTLEFTSDNVLLSANISTNIYVVYRPFTELRMNYPYATSSICASKEKNTA